MSPLFPTTAAVRGGFVSLASDGAALAVGGQSNGAPGLWPHYGPHYYAAFLIDPDGHAIEAVINGPEVS